MSGQRNAQVVGSGFFRSAEVLSAAARAALVTAATALLTVVGCGESREADTVNKSPAPRSAALIADQTNTPGPAAVNGFHWIPPVVTASPAPSTLDNTGAANGLTVRIDRLYPDNSTDATAKATFTGSGITMVTGTSNTNFPGVTGPFYGVNWTTGSSVAAGQTYRVTVQAMTPPRVLGVADVQVVANATAAAAVDRTKFAPLIAGNTLPIVFRLEARDTDGDTINNWKDNCPVTKNFNQLDADADGRGNACQCLNVPNGTACKTSSCKTGQTCQSGSCTGGGNTNNNGACSTGNPCASAETCDAVGVCGGTGHRTRRTSGSCTNGNPCKTSETCNSSGVCAGGNNASGTTPCVSGTLCRTAETCNAGVCGGTSHETRQTSGACTTGNPCRSGETCNGSAACAGGSNKANGTACNDRNLCTPDTCQTGVCTPGAAIACSADTQCHTAGSCNPSVGLCPAVRANATACTDNNACTTGDACSAGTCQGGAPVTCVASDQCHGAGTCSPATGTCSNPPLGDGTTCNDQNACTVGDRCLVGICQATSGVPCPGREDVTFYQSYNNGTTVDIAATASTAREGDPILHAPGLFGLAMDATTSFGISYATSVDVSPTNFVMSAPGSVSFWIKATPQYTPSMFFNGFDNHANLHLIVAEDSTGIVASLESYSPYQVARSTSSSTSWKTDNRWHLVVVNWSHFGFSVSFDGVRSPAAEAEALRNPTFGPNPGNLIYAGGSAVGYAKDELLILNRPLGDDEIQWYYNQATAPATINPAIARFGADDPGRHIATHLALTQATNTLRVEVDLSGLLTLNGLAAVGLEVVKTSDGSRAASTTIESWPNSTATVDWVLPALSDYINPSSPNNYELKVTLIGLGGFVNSYPFEYHILPCPVLGSVCMGPGTRDPVAGTCTFSPLPDDTVCDDGNACTQADSCRGGVCKGGNPTVCSEQGGDQCQNAGTCNPDTGLCMTLPVPNGFACNDGNPCTLSDACQDGACVGADPVTCTSLDQCHATGSCDPSTGACTTPAVSDGTACDDGSGCTVGESCHGGGCSGGESSCPLLEVGSGELITMPRFEELGIFIADEDDEFPTGINNAGDVVGYERHPNGLQTFAWRYTSQGVRYTSIPPASGSKGLAINAAGTIVGEVDLAANPIRTHFIGTFPNLVSVTDGKAFVESATGTFNVLTVSSGRAVGINDNGLMAVNAFLASGFAVAGIVQPTLDTVDPHPVGQFSESRFTGSMLAQGIGPGFAPELVGAAETSATMTVRVDNPATPGVETVEMTVYEAFSFSETSGLQNLNEMAAYATRPWKLQFATATNGKQIVGWGSFLEGGRAKCHAFRFNRSTGQQTAPSSLPNPSVPGAPSPDFLHPGNSITDLGTLPNYGAGDCNQLANQPYRARAINIRGEVVGDVAASPSAPPGGAFFYSDSTGMIDLTQALDPTLGYAIRTATGINDNGQIVGTFTKPGETKQRAYRLTLPPNFTSGPVPQFDWRMKPHFPGMDRPMAKAPPLVSCEPDPPCTGTGCPEWAPCTDAQGNPGCYAFRAFPPRCVVSNCEPGLRASCRTSCGSVGTEICTPAGVWGPCNVSYEVCDGDDNDCNGQVDDGGVCVIPRSALDPTRTGFDTVLDASLSQSPNSAITSWSWEVETSPGNTEVATGRVATMTFPREDVYPVKLTIVTENGGRATETHNVTIRNLVIASLGDSIASGEGNPDGVAIWTGEPMKVARPPSWWNRRCHRSLLSGPALTARAIEEADPRSSVTFISRACSGASIFTGLMDFYAGQEQVAPTVPGSRGDGDRDELLTPQIDALRALVSERKVDGLMLQIGANDAEFSKVIKRCARPDGTDKLFPMTCQLAKTFANGFALGLSGDGNPLGQVDKRSYPQLAPRLAEFTTSASRVYIADFPDPLRPTSVGYCGDIRLEGAIKDQTSGWSTPINWATLGTEFGDDAILDADDVLWASQIFLTNLNTSLRESAIAIGWTYVGGINAKFVGRAFCQPTRAFVQYSESLRKQLTEDGSLHPNSLGHRIYASQICPVLTRDLGLKSTFCPIVP